MPRPSTASSRKVLHDALIADEEDPSSSNDFGKNIIPGLLNAGHKMMAYPFDGYWKDVGTIDSLWEASSRGTLRTAMVQAALCFSW